jgi:hypothetical protein
VARLLLSRDMPHLCPAARGISLSLGRRDYFHGDVDVINLWNNARRWGQAGKGYWQQGG